MTRRNLHLGLWVAAALLAGAIWFLVRRWSEAGFDTRLFFTSLARANPAWLFLAVLLVVTTYLARALRWLAMLRPFAPSAPLGPVFSSTIIGFAAVLVFGRPGELVRPYLIARHAGVTIPSQVACWILERIYDTLFVLAIFGFSLVAIRYSGRPVSPLISAWLERGGWFTAILSGVCLAALILIQRHSSRLDQRLGQALGFLSQHHQERVGAFLRSAVDGFSSHRSVSSILSLLAYSLFTWFNVFLGFAALYRAFPETSAFDWKAILISIGFLAFGSLVHIPGIGGGMQVVAVLILTEIFKLPIEPAASVSLIIWLVTIAGTVPPALFLALHQGLNWRKLTQINSDTTAGPGTSLSPHPENHP